MRVRIQELIVPALAVAFVASFWIQLEGAMRPARLVPDGVMALILLLAGVVAVRDGLVRAPARSAEQPADQHGDGSGGGGLAGLLGWWRESAFVVLCVVYYFVFDQVGFHAANVVFLVATLRIMGNRWTTVLLATAITSLAIYGAAELMQFNLVTPKLFR